MTSTDFRLLRIIHDACLFIDFLQSGFEPTTYALVGLSLVHFTTTTKIPLFTGSDPGEAEPRRLLGGFDEFLDRATGLNGRQ